MKKDEVAIYKELIDIFVSRGGAISFKSISLERRGIKNAQVAFDDLYFHLLTKGVVNPVVQLGKPDCRVSLTFGRILMNQVPIDRRWRIWRSS